MHDTHMTEILLVEDNPEDAELTLRALRKHNLANRVHHVVDGEAALEYLFGTGAYAGSEVAVRPRVVLLDLKLPKVDGREVLRRMRSDERTKETPVVILTSSREESDILEGYRLGVNSYIQKPVQFDKFVEVVAHLGMYWSVLNQAVR